ncbi:sulfatase family protein [Snuella sedimenti]|uniref:Sulfatase n=1 Tax=Snuella sedimenti TaxID=2798802 RepID=A0A8J7ISW1_9FLAO|nr:sulfatase [Snuella sedimenti]MBJ6367325.1 sulfatase [Snuella sedimenti]
MKIRIVFFILSSICFLGFSQDRPNILWITFEDTSPQFVGCYGNKDARTPVMDKLAETGIRFNNAFSTGTVCSPSRSTLITGVRTFEMGTGNHRSSYPIPDFIHGFPYYLRQAGYYTSNNYKTDYNVKNAKDFTEAAWDENSDKAGWWKREQDQPFFAVFNFMDSHQSRTMTFSYESYEKLVIDKLPETNKIGEQDFSMPPIYRDSPEMRKQFARVYNSIALTDVNIGKLLKRLEDDGLRDDTIIFCFADHGEGMPRGKTNGINYGYQVPFIAWFPEKYKHLSPSKTSGAVTNEMICFEDLAPTMLAIAGVSIPKHMKGRVFATNNHSKAAPYLELSSDRSDNGIDMTRSVTDGTYIYSRNYMPFMPELRYIRYMEIGDIKQQMRNDLKNGKLNGLQSGLFEPRLAETLYNTKTDPWETENLANKPELQKVLKRFRKALDKKILSSKDVMFLPEYEIDIISKTTTPYQFRLDANNYPIAKIYKIAALSGKRGKAIAEKQIKALKSENKIIRYWAITGLKSQNKTLLKPHKAAILDAINDSYAPVSVTASAIAYDSFQNSHAEQKLKSYCKANNEYLALMALNHLLYVPNKTPFIATITELAKNDKLPYNLKAASLDILGSLNLVPNDFAHHKKLTPNIKN